MAVRGATACIGYKLPDEWRLYCIRFPLLGVETGNGALQIIFLITFEYNHLLLFIGDLHIAVRLEFGSKDFIALSKFVSRHRLKFLVSHHSS